VIFEMGAKNAPSSPSLKKSSNKNKALAGVENLFLSKIAAVNRSQPLDQIDEQSP
jgi:hypothetical protein